MRKIGILLIVCLFSIQGFGQQLPQYSQYLLNGYVINPAMAGSQPYFEGKANQRYQWEGVTDAPRTYIMSVNGPLQHRKMGIGGYLFNDITGPTRRSGMSLSYSYHVQVRQDLHFSMAVNAGLIRYSIDGSEILLENQGDAVITNQNQATTIPDAGFSFYLYGDNFFFGASAPQLVRSKIDFEGLGVSTTGRLTNHYYVLGGYQYDINDLFTIEPSFLLKYVNPIPLQYEASLRGFYDDQIWLGGSYRKNDAIALMVGYQFGSGLSFGYSYDFVQSSFQQYSTGSHEIMISLRFKDKEEKDL